MILSVKIPENLAKRLSELSKKAQRTKTSFVCEALEEFLADQEDYFEAVAIKERMEKNKERFYTLEEVKKSLGMDDDLRDAS